MLAIPVDSAAQRAAARASRLRSGTGASACTRLTSGIGLLTLLALGACSSTPPAGPTILSKSRSAETLVLLPLNVTAVMPPELARSSPTVYAALEEHLRAQGGTLKTVSFPSARKLWLDSIREARSGPRGAKADFDDAAAIFVKRLAEHAAFDAVIVSSLFVQRANIDGGTASWDGTERALTVEIARRAVTLPPDAGLEGAAPAASLHTVVLDGAGAKIHEKQAGLALLSRVRMKETSTSGGPRFDFVPIVDPFDDPDLLAAGIARAFSPYIPESTPKP